MSKSSINNKSQVTIFIILALLILLTMVIVIYYISIMYESTEAKSAVRQSVSFSKENVFFEEYVTSCLKRIAEDSLESFGTDLNYLTSLLKLQGMNCFNNSAFYNVDINFTLPMSVEIAETNQKYNIKVNLKTVTTQGEAVKKIDSYSFSVLRNITGATPGTTATVNIDGEDYDYNQPAVSLAQDPYVDGEIIVSYKNHPTDERVYNQTLESLNIISRELLYEDSAYDLASIDEDLREFIEDLSLDEKMTYDSELTTFGEIRDELMQLSFIENVSRNVKAYSNYFQFTLTIRYGKTSYYAVNDPLYRYQWYLKNTGQFFGKPGADIDIEHAWNLTTGSSNVVISVIDQGVFLNPDIVDSLIYDKSYNFVENNYNFMPSSFYEYHGTHVAGTIAAQKDNYYGVAGVCPNCKLINMRIMDAYNGADSQTLINAVLLSVSNGAKIVSMSLGGSEYSAYEEKVFKGLADRGIVFVAAAGNDGSSSKSYPAAYNGVISVAASDNTDQLAYYSNYGSWVDIAAPGDLIMNACGSSIFCFNSGTSMATPVVSGVIGLMLSKNPSLTPSTIESKIKQTANYTSDSQRMKRINAYEAVKVAN